MEKRGERKGGGQFLTVVLEGGMPVRAQNSRSAPCDG